MRYQKNRRSNIGASCSHAVLDRSATAVADADSMMAAGQGALCESYVTPTAHEQRAQCGVALQCKCKCELACELTWRSQSNGPSSERLGQNRFELN